ncbi:alpha/beta hydrolase [Thiocystis violascens]|uniref:Esterase/lipase n=1 Tax=Thiocystis violascens (strain ATCC 17096 / DSM 198 / 6111) TaxID=765911 RepID=I3Y7P7_THIV6|nr:alpha/beta hydrolase [Thiocystis violascens]AFL73015.1 esterase/lipase [Thiocystis violascens DSM 198]
MHPLPPNLPAPLSAFLTEVREIKRLRVAAGYRHTPTNAREALEFMTRRHLIQIPPIALIRDEIIPGADYDVPVRLYHPAPDEPLPVALFVHGGGHVSGSVSLYDPIARKLAAASRRLIVSIDYRLAPECPYPNALKDLIACVKGVFPLLDSLRDRLSFTPRLALVGDSGGGALCASAAHLTQFEPGVAIERQALIYPSLDYTLSKPSVTENGEGLLLERQRILWYFDSYFQRAENRREVSPLFMPLTPDYPPTLVATAEFCPLRDEGIAYVERLREYRIKVEHIHYPGLVHAFLNLEDLVPDTCAELYRRVGDFLAGPTTRDDDAKSVRS